MAYLTELWIDKILVHWYYSNEFMIISSDDFMGSAARHSYMFFDESEAIALHLDRFHNTRIEAEYIFELMTSPEVQK